MYILFYINGVSFKYTGIDPQVYLEYGVEYNMCTCYIVSLSKITNSIHSSCKKKT